MDARAATATAIEAEQRGAALWGLEARISVALEVATKTKASLSSERAAREEAMRTNDARVQKLLEDRSTRQDAHTDSWGD